MQVRVKVYNMSNSFFGTGRNLIVSDFCLKKETIISKDVQYPGKNFSPKNVINQSISNKADGFSANILEEEKMATIGQVILVKTASVSAGCLMGNIWPVSRP